MDLFFWKLVLLGLAASLLASLGGLAVVALLLVNLPAHYFCRSHPRDFWVDRHPLIRWTGLIVKNVLGAVAVALGTVLSMPGIPGPGVLMVLIGITLLDFPGKRRLERWLIAQPTVLGTINRLRQRYGRPPLYLDE